MLGSATAFEMLVEEELEGSGSNVLHQCHRGEVSPELRSLPLPVPTLFLEAPGLGRAGDIPAGCDEDRLR